MSWYGTKKASRISTMDKRKILVFDTETTGINPTYNDILQITILDGYGTVLLDTYIKPKHRKSWPRAQTINHISYKMVKDAPLFSDIRKKIQNLFNKANLIVGYNVNFDINFIKKYGIIVSAEVFDVMTEFDHYHIEVDDVLYKGHSSLAACAKYFGYSFRAHDASEDARATLYCFNKLISDASFTTYKKKEKKRLKENGKNDVRKRKRVGFSVQFKTHKRIPLLLKGMISILVGELIYFFINDRFFYQMENYLSELSDIIAKRPIELIRLIMYTLIGLGCIFLCIGIVKVIITLPIWIKVQIDRIIKRIID